MVKPISSKVHIFGCLFLFTMQAVFALDSDLHFWPTSVTLSDPMRSGTIFEWPDYQVLLQNKSGTSYEPAIIGDFDAQQLAHIFTLTDASLITIHRQEDSGTWGLTIPGGARLRKENLTLLPSMTEKFIACLRTLSETELNLIKGVLYAPLAMIKPDGSLSLSDEHKHIASTMFHNFQNNRCEGETTVIPELVQQKVNIYLSAFLSGSNSEVTGGALLVLTTLFKDLLFSQKGLWVRVTLAAIQDFIAQRLAVMPLIKDRASLQRDYESFVDFILVSKDTSGLTKNHYVSIAGASSIASILDVFKPFLLKQYFAKAQINAIDIHIGSQGATIFLKGTAE